MTETDEQISLWRAILDSRWPLPEIWTAAPPLVAAERFGFLVTPALAANILAPVEARLGFPLLDAKSVKSSLLINRLNGAVQRRWMHEIADTGIPVICLKGFAFAHYLYPDPDIRTIGDIDVLVRQQDLDRLLLFLTGRGFRFEALQMPAWGFISDASFMPLMSENGDCNIDVHVQPDCYPAYRSLTAENVFEAAVDLEIGDTVARVPSIEHSLLLCLTNAAKDKFGPLSVRKLLDLVMLLKSGSTVDWDVVRSLAVAGRFLKPARVAFSLLDRLGMPRGAVPDAFLDPPGGLATGPFARLVRDYGSMFAEEPPTMRVLERELTLCAEPDVAYFNAVRRLKGLIWRKHGLPAGYSAG